MLVMTGTLAVVFGGYFAIVVRWLTTTAADDIVYQPLMFIAVVPLVVLAALGHAVIALFNRTEANSHDERDRLVGLRAERIGRYVLATGVFAGLTLAMVELAQFYIAHVLLLAWVVAEITTGVVTLALYRRGG